MPTEPILRTETAAHVSDLIDDGRRRIIHRIAAIYVVLWILEGAFRKWLPATDSLFYVVRDFTLILGLCVAFLRAGPSRHRQTATLLFWTSVTAFSILGLLEVVIKDVPISIAIFGVRNYVAPLLLPFVIFRERITTFAISAARILVAFAPVQLVLVILQVNSAPSAWINLQTGGEQAYFTTSSGVVRAAGSFSAPAGLIAYLTLALAASLTLLLSNRKSDIFRGWIGVCSIAPMIALGGSRSAVFSAAIVASGWLLYNLAQGRIKYLTIAILGLAVASIAVSAAMAALPTVFRAFLVRFDAASQSEDTVGRVLDSFSAFVSTPAGLFGNGIGMQSTIGVSLGSGLAWVEADSARGVQELGVLGLCLAITRIVAGAYIFVTILLQPRRVTAFEYLFAIVALPLLVAGSITTQPSTQGQFGITIAIILSASFLRRAA